MNRTVAFACCYSWTLVGHMAAPNLLILADLIAPFIPLGLCGSLSVVAGGLSLLFPSCWRKPLPNTVEEAENKALVPIKDRYPSFRDLSRSGKLAALVSPSPAPSNVYSVPQTCPKDPDQNRCPMTTTSQSYNPNHQVAAISGNHYYEGHYEVADPESEINGMHNSDNWQLYGEGGIMNRATGDSHLHHKSRNPRDGRMFRSASRGPNHHQSGNTSHFVSNTSLVDFVAETNL